MGVERLLAKSAGGEAEAVGLLRHSASVLAAAEGVLAALQGDLSGGAGGVEFGKLGRMVRMGAVLHDVGKANNVFQGKVRGEVGMRDCLQPMRHEILSALVVAGRLPELSGGEAFACWVRERLEEVGFWGNAAWLLSWVVGGHHFRMHPCSELFPSSLVNVQSLPPGNLKFLGEDVCEGFYRLLAGAGGGALGDLRLGNHSISTRDDGRGGHVELVEEYLYESERVSEEVSVEDRRLVAFAKACLAAADVVGSAKGDWADGDLRGKVACLLKMGVAEEGVAKIVESRLEGADLRGFQEELAAAGREGGADEAGSRVLLEAACGGGKTVAAYCWARGAAGGRKLFFCYPTTGTASEGYRDYLHAQSDVERELIHSRAEVDLGMMRDNGDGGEETPEEAGELRDRGDALHVWGQAYVVCTVDAVLGVMQNQRRGILNFPAIARGAFVFDEIHSYDEKLFGALVRFLYAFPRLPVLLMTASLQRNRRKKLRAALRGQGWRLIFTSPRGRRREKSLGDNWRVIRVHGDSEGVRRYRLTRFDKAEACVAEVAAKIKEWRGGGGMAGGGGAPLFDVVASGEEGGVAGRVLWVCNTVGAAREVYAAVKAAVGEGVEVLLFHSRFRYKDRVVRAREVMARFRENKPCVVVATQVCEMSLDISADLLITERCPFSAFVQRLGRLNRYADADGVVREGAACWEYENKGARDGRPYLLGDLEVADGLMGELAGRGDFSQLDLRGLMRRDAKGDGGDLRVHSAWLDDPWESGRAPVREGEGSVAVLLEGDVGGVGDRAAAVACSVPMYEPRGRAWRVAGRRRFGFWVARGDCLLYDEETGAMWAWEAKK